MPVKNKQKTAFLIFLCCWATYMTAYLCRVNFSSAMDALCAERHMAEDRLGAAGAVFYAVYACGQLINGYIGDRVKPDRFILLALGGTMLCNMGMAAARTSGQMTALWGVNGYFQSMFWSTIIRILALNSPPEKRVTVSVAISLSLPLAYLLSWGLLGRLFAGKSAGWYFMVPALLCLGMAGLWLAVRRMDGVLLPRADRRQEDLGRTLRLYRDERLYWLTLTAFFHGLVKEGTAYWMPLLIVRTDSLAGMPPFALVCVLPLANLVGIASSRFVLGRPGVRPLRVLSVLTGTIVLLCFSLWTHSSGLFLIGMIALISALTIVNNVILMSLFPMQYTGRNMVASVAGVLDFSSYAGAAVSTYLVGKILHSGGFGPVPLIWCAAAAAGLLSAHMFQRRRASAPAV